MRPLVPNAKHQSSLAQNRLKAAFFRSMGPSDVYLHTCVCDSETCRVCDLTCDKRDDCCGDTTWAHGERDDASS